MLVNRSPIRSNLRNSHVLHDVWLDVVQQPYRLRNATTDQADPHLYPCCRVAMLFPASACARGECRSLVLLHLRGLLWNLLPVHGLFEEQAH